MYKEAQAAPPLPPQLDSFVSKAAVAHMIIHLLDLFTPLHFSWGDEIFFMKISFGHCQSIKQEPVAQTCSRDMQHDRQHRHAAWRSHMAMHCMKHGHEARTGSMEMKHGHEAWM
jgi:hypothetical protein